MSDVVGRVFCQECGAIRIRQPRSAFSVCPLGHGRLIPGVTASERRQAIEIRIPAAHRRGRKAFSIDGHEGRFVYVNGRRAAAPDQKVGELEVLGRYVTKKRVLLRVFTRKPEKRAKT